MINVKIECALQSMEGERYEILLLVESLDENFNNQLIHIDETLNLLFGDESDYKKKTNKSITKIVSVDGKIDYFLPCDIDVLITVLELFTYKNGTNAFLGDTLITREQLSRDKRGELRFLVSEFIKNNIIEMKEVEKEVKKAKALSLEQILNILNELN